jgi:hypothetical protein
MPLSSPIIASCDESSSCELLKYIRTTLFPHRRLLRRFPVPSVFIRGPFRLGCGSPAPRFSPLFLAPPLQIIRAIPAQNAPAPPNPNWVRFVPRRFRYSSAIKPPPRHQPGLSCHGTVIIMPPHKSPGTPSNPSPINPPRRKLQWLCFAKKQSSLPQPQVSRLLPPASILHSNWVRFAQEHFRVRARRRHGISPTPAKAQGTTHTSRKGMSAPHSFPVFRVFHGSPSPSPSPYRCRRVVVPSWFKPQRDPLTSFGSAYPPHHSSPRIAPVA